MQGETRLKALYIQEKIACDMGRKAQTIQEKEYYKNELKKIRTEIENLSKEY